MLRVRPIVSGSTCIRISTIRQTSTLLSENQSAASLLPIVATCPSPTCACAETPTGLDIDREKDLNGSMAPYAQHVVISTGKSDWTSRIENDGHGTPWGEFGRQLKAMLGRRGKYSDPYNNIMITNSSFTSGTVNSGLEALLLPSFQVVRSNKYNHTAVEQIIQEHLLPKTLHPMHKTLSDVQRATLTRKARPSTSDHVSDLTRPTVLICSHNTRDTRCGVIGPVLQSEFARQLSKLRYNPCLHRPLHDSGLRSRSGEEEEDESKKVNVGLISHIGGHKWAGNVIVYLPPAWSSESKEPSRSPDERKQASSLAGCGVWYGRVEPKHVEGIIKETILEGRVIQELFRGGIGPGSEVLRLPSPRELEVEKSGFFGWMGGALRGRDRV